MLIQSARFNTVFPRISNLRRKAIDIEDSIKEHYSAITLVPVPDDAPEVIPRIQAASKNGHSNIEISLTNSQVTVNFDEHFNKDWTRCINYIRERSAVITAALKPYLNEGTLFSGLILEAMIEDISPIELIKQNFLNYKADRQPHDLEYKLTYVLHNSYFVNLTFKNVRLYEGVIPVGTGMINFSELKEKQNVLGITIDVNDRFEFNRDNSYRSSEQATEKIFDIISDLFNGKLDKMIREGVIDL